MKKEFYTKEGFKELNKNIFENTLESDNIDELLKQLVMHVENLQNTETSNCVNIQLNRFNVSKILLREIEKHLDTAEHKFVTNIDELKPDHYSY